LTEFENTYTTEHLSHREKLNEEYIKLTKQYGILNAPGNRQRILKDEAFGDTILASLERKDGDNYIKADIFSQSLFEKKEIFTTDNPIEALARSLNDTGKVDVEFISAATGLSNDEVVRSLGNHIYLNPSDNGWQTADQFLSGNVVVKLNIAKTKVEENPDDIQLQKSFEALEKVQPDTIPFELLDFNLGERWIPQEYYNRFASALFELNTEVNYFQSSMVLIILAIVGFELHSKMYSKFNKYALLVTINHSF